jgi:hypothetical protein
MPLLLYFSVSVCCFSMLLIVFFVQKAILSCVFLNNFVICLTSFPQYVKMAHFFYDGLDLPVCFVYVVSVS